MLLSDAIRQSGRHFRYFRNHFHINRTVRGEISTRSTAKYTLVDHDGSSEKNRESLLKDAKAGSLFKL